jgi:CDP-diacylglycerol--serine O-phosphatidyltransferase
VAYGTILNPANAITFSRFAALPVFAWAAARGEWQLAAIALIYCAGLDLFDGAVARRLGCASPFGEMLDAATDAICFGFFIAVLAYHERMPRVPSVGFLALGVVNALFRLIYARRAGRTTNYRSYAMERTVAFTAFAIGLAAIGIEVRFFAYATLAVMAVVLAHDTKRMLIDPPEPRPAISGSAA